MGRGRKAKKQKEPRQSSVQSFTWKAAVAYVNTVEKTLTREGQTSRYHDFLQLLTDFTVEALPADRIVARVNDIFRLHTQLLVGFNEFLPEEYHFHPATPSGRTDDDDHQEHFR